ncbi:cation efflux family protein-like protein [Cucurbitaria berberidis CBS 394.84]|uniref:Cation efflux family protein-like protein n=1 Tax=Cucurbitaria berberidis CBS 394.84 TaxID=1168544 RepID=A0A9P4GAR5_9PLEO|nr:cation efflux family protein-like protein [Cucurbitaria berberidis CBS 394.84]KAF1842145.1 cation efflux family protein-like protein [Cucurbitaria berberidis CBS 394.84]
MPLPLPPRTPTPPPEEDTTQPVGLGLEGELSPGKLGFGTNTLSPMSATFPSRQYATLAPNDSISQRPSPSTIYTPASATFPYTPASAASGTNDTDALSLNGSENGRNPFNFQPVPYQPERTQAKQNDIGRRRGHKYKHSSVSHQIFLEPAPRAPLQLPASLPVPTFKEYRSSMSKDQKLRLAWCFCHLVVAGLVQWGAHESLALTVLSRLIFYDALGAFLCIAVDIGSNFELWKRSSIRHPFGFERLEVIAGLGMSVGLLFMGLDLISHGLTHALENTGGHQAHHADAHERVSPGSIDLAALSGIVSTLVSAILLKNHARIGKVMRLGAIANLPSVLSNPSHFLTLSCSTLLLLLPLLSIQMYVWLDRTLSFSVAFAMVALGWIQGWTLGKMLLMSYSGPGVSDVMYDIETDPSISVVEEAKFWQVHYGLCQANLKLRVRNLEDIGRLRDRIGSMVRNRLGGGYGSGGQKWEVSTQITLEKD